MNEAKVYPIQHPRYSWMVKFTRKGFPQYRRYFHDEETAKADATAYNERLFREGSEGIHIGPRERRALQNLLAVLEQKKISIVEATDFIQANYGRKGEIPVADAIFALLEARERQGRSQRTITNLQSRLEAFAAHSGLKFIDDAKPDDCRQWIYAAGSSRSQVNNYRALSNLFNFMVRRGEIERSPLAQVEPPKGDKLKRPAVFTVPQAREFMERIAAHEEGRFVPFFAISLFAGLRPSEIEELQAGDIGKKFIRVDGGKMRGRSRRIVPLMPNLAAWLEAYPGEVCPMRLESPGFTTARKLSPVDWENDIARHSFISYRLATVRDENQVAREAGNSPAIIYSNYFDLVAKASGTAYFKIRP